MRAPPRPGRAPLRPARVSSPGEARGLTSARGSSTPEGRR
uniref:Uncharacterized protein n=1 Tax=Setaria italica TaxID=4555 RepID=K4A3K5_SETIT